MHKSRFVGLVPLLFASSISSSLAQEPPALVTDRPDQTESAVVIPRGTFQFEIGLGLARDDDRDEGLETLEAPSTLLRWGLFSRVELRLAWPGWVEVENRSSGLRSRLSGGGDPEMGTKVSFLSTGRGDAFDLALLAHLSLPVGDVALGSPRADPSIRLNGAHDLGANLGFGWNVGYEAESSEVERGDVGTLGRFVYTAALGVDLAPRWGVFVELFGDLPASDPLPAAHSFDAGMSFLVRPSVALDVAAGVGLSAAAPDWFVGVGVSVRVPR